MSLPRFSVRQVVLVNLLFVLLSLAGVQSARRIPVDLFPDISFITQKLEDEVDGISGVKEILSYSSHGLSEITIEWQETLSELEYEAALNDLRAAIDRVDDLPEDAETPVLRELSVSEAHNVCMVAVIDVGGVGEFTVREVARDLQDRLERIPGLRRAELRGERERELRVLVDRKLAAQYDVTLVEISSLIAANNQNFAGGSFTDALDREVRVRGLGQFASAEQLAATVVRKNPDGTHVRLSDVAEVTEGFEKRRIFGRHNGRPSIVLGISKEAETDIIDLVATVRAFVSDYADVLPEGVEAKLTWDSAAYVDARIRIMRSGSESQ